MPAHRIFIRNIDAGNLMETFMVSAVAAVLGIRFFLHITGYPQVGGGGLHIAHMLWGGLLMVVAIILSLSLLSKASDHWAALLGGIGFGTFIDEVGKFITADNNYFYQPSVSLMYITFILIFLGIRGIQSYRKYSSREYIMNALRELEEVVSHDLDREERDHALNLLARSKTENILVNHLQNLFSQIDLVPVPQQSLLTRIRYFFRNQYRTIAHTKYFSSAIVVFFIIQLIVKLIYAFILVFVHGLGWTFLLNAGFFQRFDERLTNLSFVDWGQIVFSFVSTAFVILGVYSIRRSRLKAYKMFERSILIAIFFTQGFAFYKEQFSALIGLLFNVFIFLGLRYMIKREEIGQIFKP